MSNQYISNSDIYQVNAERDISVILSRFNTQYIYDCIDNALLLKNSTQFITPNPNLVRSLKDNFIVMTQQFPDDIANIKECEEETYIEIINYLCSKFNLEFNDNDNIDLYSAAYYIYDLLVCNYLKNLVEFYTRFILKEKNSIYRDLNLEQFKKTANINYSKKVFKDSITSNILINITYVIDNLSAFDFDFDTIVNIVYGNSQISSFINSIFEDQGYFYNFYKNDIINPVIRPNIMTNIRLSIQNSTINEDIINTFIKENN